MAKNNWERPAIFVFGLIGLGIILASAVFFENPTPWQYTVFRITLALAAAGIGALIPGFLHVEMKPGLGAVVRAGGAMAVFVIVYFFSPTALGHSTEYRILNATSQQMSFAYKTVYGPPPKDPNPPLLGAKIGPASNANDLVSGGDFVELFKQKTVKVVLPFYIGSQCPRMFLDGLVFADGLSAFLSKPVDIFVLNVGERPTFGELREFIASWKLGNNAHFISGTKEEMDAVFKKFGIYRQPERDAHGKIVHTGYANVTFAFSPEGNPLAIALENGTMDDFRSVLYFVAQDSPELLNRDLLARYIPETAAFLLPSANAVPSIADKSLLGEKVAAISANRVSDYEQQGKSLKCHSGHN